MIDNLKLVSDKFVEKTFENYIKQNNQMGFYLLLLGKGNFKLESFPGAGHNYHKILGSIYDYYKNNPEVDVKKIFEQALNLCINKLCLIEDFTIIMNYIYAQLDNEDKKIAPFEINALKMLNNLKFRINSYPKLKDDENLIEQLKKSEIYLSENFSHKIL